MKPSWKQKMLCLQRAGDTGTTVSWPPCPMVPSRWRVNPRAAAYQLESVSLDERSQCLKQSTGDSSPGRDSLGALDTTRSHAASADCAGHLLPVYSYSLFTLLRFLWFSNVGKN